MTKNLDQYVDNCKQLLDTLDIPYRDFSASYNGRIKSKWGYCKRVNDGFQIHIARRLSEDDVSDNALLSVLYHEILHTCPGCFNHGKKWKRYAKLVKAATGVKIRTTCSAEEIEVAERYFVKCRTCKKKVRYAMKPRNNHGTCPYCGSSALSCFYKESKQSEKIRIWKN